MRPTRALTAAAGTVIAAAALIAGTATPSAAAVSDCPDFGVVCAFKDVNYGGKPVWTESRPGYYSFTGSIRGTTSVINRTAYKIRIVGSNQFLGYCISRGKAVRDLPDGFDDKLSVIEIDPPASSTCDYTF
ncbi:peptidase inhibitor family I36 protein [Streptomyces geranii]|uniref:peptidase inhibitor family I36 protein n=1 Tax=Streptomyces geranii TaxID=2058923 RepID=UPI000D0442C8|nr:peptidase inhibitor family I36 protein [Streptomyces geranii]